MNERVRTLADYKGPSNSTEIFQYLVGEKIVGVFQARDGEYMHTYFVLSSGEAFVLNSNGAFWKADSDGIHSWRSLLESRREEIARMVREIEQLGRMVATE